MLQNIAVMCSPNLIPKRPEAMHANRCNTNPTDFKSISKRLDDFSFDFNKQGEKLPIDDKIADLRFKHY